MVAIYRVFSAHTLNDTCLACAYKLKILRPVIYKKLGQAPLACETELLVPINGTP